MQELHKELSERSAGYAESTKDWTDEEVETFTRLFRRFNEGAEARRGRPWPRKG
ncbi:hypothetical protein [Corynebacterium lubricantis]|uniref:hypothetical protein n=1 Tax=Corynebacterium lubricantis TaxID=541095 RepID=UPI00039FF329|nr:hypothetical protein [Corynebacterium lubricantis]